MMPEFIAAIVMLRALAPAFAFALPRRFNSKNWGAFRVLVVDVCGARN